MKILMVHNYYQQAGGEDVVVEQETTILREAGHQVVEYRRSNDEIKSLGLKGKLFFAKQLIWADDAIRDLKILIQREKPHVAHFHNTFAMISPAAYHVCRKLNIPVVQSLHNYRLLCPKAIFYKDGYICESCVGKIIAWPAVLHGCYHDSRSHTAAIVVMLAIHRWLKTWSNKVDVYIALTEFGRQKFIQGGLPEDNIMVKPNFVFPDPGVAENNNDNYIIFVGRLSPEKKISTLLVAMKKLPGIQLKVLGSGPQLEELSTYITEEKLENVELLGYQSHEKILALIRNARFLIFPSETYEGFGMSIIEAFSCGVPVVGSDLGAIAEIIEHGRTGLLFKAGGTDDLISKIEWAWMHEKEMHEMGKAARKQYEEKYTAEKNLAILMDIYQAAISKRWQARKYNT